MWRGIRNLDTVEKYLNSGVDYIIIGTAAVKNPGFLHEACYAFPGQIIVGLDAKEGEVAIDGWAKLTGHNVIELAKKFEGYGVEGIIYTAEVENALFAHDAVADAAVIGVPDDRWGEAVKAVVVLKPGKTATEEDIIHFVKSKIAGYKVPKTVDFVTALPRNPTGKLLKRELRAPYWEKQGRQIN